MEHAKLMQTLEDGKKHHTAELKKKISAPEKARHKQALLNIDAKMKAATEAHNASPEVKALSAKMVIVDLVDRVEELEGATPAQGTPVDEELQKRVVVLETAAAEDKAAIDELKKSVAGLQLLMPKPKK